MKYRSATGNTSQSGSLHVIIAAVIGVGLVAAIGFLLWQNALNKPTASAVTSYTECVKAPESKILESYPEKCVTKDGKSFTNPDQKVSKSDDVATKTFCAPLEKLCFDYPENWKVVSDTVSQDEHGLSERFVVKDESGKSWLRLQTGMSGLGGACVNEDGSFAKILKTHTTGVTGEYLVGEGAEQRYDPVAYAVGLVGYDGTSKRWTVDMFLDASKATHQIAKVDTCDVRFTVLNGKNARFDPEYDGVGAVTFVYYHGSTEDPTYTSEAEATAVLSSANAEKAYGVLQSARYQ